MSIIRFADFSIEFTRPLPCDDPVKHFAYLGFVHAGNFNLENAGDSICSLIEQIKRRCQAAPRIGFIQFDDDPQKPATGISVMFTDEMRFDRIFGNDRCLDCEVLLQGDWGTVKENGGIEKASENAWDQARAMVASGEIRITEEDEGRLTHVPAL